MWRSCPDDSFRLLRPPDLSLQGRTQQRQLAVPLIRRKCGLMRINALATQRCFCSDVQRGYTCRSASQSRPGIDLRRALVGLLQPPTPGCLLSLREIAYHVLALAPLTSLDEGLGPEHRLKGLAPPRR